MKYRSTVVLATLITGMLFLSLGPAATASAQELTGEEIALKADAVDSSKDSVSDLTMTIERRGKKRLRQIQAKSMKFGDDEKMIMKFLKPADVAGTMFLVWSYADVDKDDDMWLFLPEDNLTRRISSSNKKSSFMGSDFAYEDMEGREVAEDTHKLLRKENLRGHDCYVVEAVPKKIDQDSQYSKYISWVRQDNFVIIKVEFYDKKGEGKLFKVMNNYDIKKIDGIWTVTRMEMEELKKKSMTILTFENISYNTGLKDEEFGQQNLRK